MADIEQFVPAESDAAFQQRQSQYLADIIGRSHNYEQAQKDVAAARAMMGSVRVQQLIQKGADPAQAYYSNMHYFVQPNDKGFSGVMQQLRPVPPPYTTNFPGISAPVVIAPTRAGQTVHFPPPSVLPQPAPPRQVSAIPVINADGTTNANLVATPAAGGKGVVVHSVKTPSEGSLTEVQKARLRQLDIAEREARNLSFLGDRDKTLGEIRQEREAIYGNKPLILKDKKTGARFNYTGRKEDVPTDEFDIE